MKRHPSASSWIVCVVLFLSGCGGMGTNMLAPSLRITTMDAPAGATTVRYNGKNGFTLAAEGGTPPYKWSWAPAPNYGLPPGLTLNDNRISGTPQSSGDFRIVVTVTDSGHPAAQTTAAYTVAVDAPLAITSGLPPGDTVGVVYGPIGTIYLKCVWSSTGVTQQVCTRCDPAISGSCPANRTNCAYPNTCTKTTQNHAGFQFTATGGAAPYTWTGTGLPPGLGLYPTFGIMSGTPTTLGTYNITITVKDSEPTPQELQAKYSITISRSTAKYTLDGSCSGALFANNRPVQYCAIVPDHSDCPVGEAAITTTNSCELIDVTRTCTVIIHQMFPPITRTLRGHCGATANTASAPQSLSGQAEREVSPLRLDKLPEIAFPLADSTNPQ